MNASKTILEYLAELSSSSPTPGGGNVAAFCGALASSLGIMVCNLTIGKKKYADVESEIISLKEKLEDYQKKFLELAQKDNEAFNKVMEAMKLPKENEEQIEIRSKKIEEATLHAAEIPSEVIKYCSSILPLLKIIIDKGNKNSISDAGVAVSLIKSSAQSAYLNVLINCKSLNNQTIASEFYKSVQVIFDEVQKTTDLYLNIITSLLKS
ncbi:MAG: cyclodeaminase/cyclohydrolase family protein [Melioribacter sp.]|uniref:cyclodeaminase/cyclohydrolase family protein n=1 Tax=Rosettibacter primus TaxID=3111523 RepID=UPI00247CBD11|nr:cyclodeaminase/cyclohydrolase family protein [Melioribacter sp.]